jgi:hypothetical protein
MEAYRTENFNFQEWKIRCPAWWLTSVIPATLRVWGFGDKEDHSSRASPGKRLARHHSRK